jgi:hypothetical protein
LFQGLLAPFSGNINFRSMPPSLGPCTAGKHSTMSVDRVIYLHSLTNVSDDALNQLEAAVPALSGQAFDTARRQALASGLSVLETENGVLFEVFPDGRKVRIKAVPPPQTIVSGQRFAI